jgi:uncharacterized protein YpmS
MQNLDYWKVLTLVLFAINTGGAVCWGLLAWRRWQLVGQLTRLRTTYLQQVALLREALADQTSFQNEEVSVSRGSDD